MVQKKRSITTEDLMENQLNASVRRTALPRVLTLEEVDSLMEMSLQPKFRSIRSFVALSVYGGLRAEKFMMTGMLNQPSSGSTLL